ncbi:MAG TPA: hypothetical protein VKV39_12420 [Candidatus Sulfotelmatobacter sp.]|nr:hypothetical protein [Candidatus Sulfotelmatobacter sp.]
MEPHEGLSASSSTPATDSTISLQAVARQVHDELRQLLQLRADVTRRIGTLKRTVDGLASVFGENALTEELRHVVENGRSNRRQGFTKTCREILTTCDSPVTAREVYDRLLKAAPILLERHKDPLASVTTVLNRLVEYGEAQRVTLPDNKRAWRWVAESDLSGQHTLSR